MKVAIISTYPEKTCGISVYIKNLKVEYKKQFGSNNISSFKITNDWLNRSKSSDINVVYPEDIISTVKQLNKSYDVVHLHYEASIFNYGSYPLLNYYNLYTFLRSIKKPIIITLHSPFGFVELQKDCDFIFNKICTLQHVRYVVHSEYQRKELILKFRLEEEKIYYLPLGTFQNINNLNSIEKKRLYTLKRKHKSSINLVSLGFIEPRKGVLEIIQSFSEIIQSNNNIKLFIIGSSTYAPLYKVQCIEYIKQLMLTNKIIFKDKFISDSEYKVYLKFSDIYLANHIFESQTSSASLTDSICAGCAIVCMKMNFSNNSVIKDALLISGSKMEFIENIKLLINNKTLRNDYSKKCLNISKHWNWAWLVKDYHQIYTSQKEFNIDNAQFSYFSGPLSLKKLFSSKWMKIYNNNIIFSIFKFPLQRLDSFILYKLLNEKFIKIQIIYYTKLRLI